jgi:hypothetical protein
MAAVGGKGKGSKSASAASVAASSAASPARPTVAITYNVAVPKLERMANAQNNLVNALTASIQFQRMKIHEMERTEHLDRETERLK